MSRRLIVKLFRGGLLSLATGGVLLGAGWLWPMPVTLSYGTARTSSVFAQVHRAGSPLGSSSARS
jgi:hypothetical protein